MKDYAVVDLFCGVGGLTYGLIKKKINVVAGIDFDKSCEYAYNQNNKGAKFHHINVFDLTPEELGSFYPKGKKKILVGCAPCQPFSLYNKKRKNISEIEKDSKWKLLNKFADLIVATMPEIISMENVMSLKIFNGGAVLKNFTDKLEKVGYKVSVYDVNAQDYGTPQRRKRLVVFGTLNDKSIELIPSTHKSLKRQ
jgi:DNA (cytosine-5)-methyltransferase 1